MEKCLVSIVQDNWPSRATSTRLCFKCDDSLRLNFHFYDYDEVVRNARLGLSPTKTQVARYEEMLEESLDDLDACHKELRRLQDAIESIEAQEKMLKAFTDGLRYILSPIHRLPDDILIEIFKQICCGQAGINFMDHSFYRRPLPTLALRGVCSRWSHLIENTPMLWSSFGIRCIPDRDDLGLLFPFYGDFVLLPLFTSEVAKRLHSVALRGRSVSIIRAFLRPWFPNLRLPELVTLDIDCGPASDMPVFAVDCPKLKSLLLCGLALKIQYPLPSVTHLVLDDLSMKAVMDIIKCCPNLLDITLKKLCTKNDSLPKDTPSIHCNARRLTIEFIEESEGVLSFLSLMIFPLLTHLALVDPFSKERPITALCSMLEKSHCAPTTLRICNVRLNKTDLLRLFSYSSCVTDLELEQSPFSLGVEAEALILRALADHVKGDGVGDGDSGGSAGDPMVIDGPENRITEKRNKEVMVPEAKCLLPELEILKLRGAPCPDLILKLIRSRWKRPTCSIPNRCESSAGSEAPGEAQTQTQSQSKPICAPLQILRARCLYVRKRGHEIDRSEGKKLWESCQRYREEGLDVIVSY
ncbi:hypothetical protein GYMLUDRAFT_238000 [Collybiopsis luxurians FD-317 M1]|nr:hypothetical protein GYMLUDRAFT_238000 [Collybiopsis luxurians FD-317 M1]